MLTAGSTDRTNWCCPAARWSGIARSPGWQGSLPRSGCIKGTPLMLAGELSLRICRRFLEPVCAGPHHTFNGGILFLDHEHSRVPDSRTCRPQSPPGFGNGEISVYKFEKINGGPRVRRNVNRKRQSAIGAFLPTGLNQALHRGNGAFRKSQAARFRPDIKRGKSAARGLDPGDVFQQEIAGVGSPGVVHFTTGIETFSIGFVFLEHGPIAGQIADRKIVSARI